MKKRQDILQAAERLFYAKGFHATSTDSICSEAGVSTRTLYRYFSSREALTAAVLSEREKRFFAGLYEPQHPQSIGRMFEELGQWMEMNGAKGCFFLKAWGEYAERDISLSRQALAFRYAMREYISACISHLQGAENAMLTDAVWMLFEGAITAALVIGPQAARRAAEAAELLVAHSGETR